MRKPVLIVISILVTFWVSSSALADAGDKIFRFGLKYISPTGDLTWQDSSSQDFNIDGSMFTFEFSEQGKAEADSTIGLGIGFEYMATDLIGIDTNLNYSKHDFDETISGSVTITPWIGDPPVPDPGSSETGQLIATRSGEISMIPLTIGMNFHIFQSDSVDFYLGPLVGYVFYSDLETDAGSTEFITASYVFPVSWESEKISIKDDFAYGAVLGIDTPFGSGEWNFSAAAKYLKTKAEVDEAYSSEEIDIDPWVIQIGFGYRF